MMKCSMWILLGVFVGSGTLWAADGPFNKKWKLNPASSQMPDVMKVNPVGPN